MGWNRKVSKDVQGRPRCPGTFQGFLPQFTQCEEVPSNFFIVFHRFRSFYHFLSFFIIFSQFSSFFIVFSPFITSFRYFFHQFSHFRSSLFSFLTSLSSFYSVLTSSIRSEIPRGGAHTDLPAVCHWIPAYLKGAPLYLLKKPVFVERLLVFGPCIIWRVPPYNILETCLSSGRSLLLVFGSSSGQPLPW